ncbi:MAG: lysophospholipid acyltransferase family protein [Sporomusaceae bacterium]|nr:lysophospholipid acyltransferase family protein [Sporomusaceae bacterium]
MYILIKALSKLICLLPSALRYGLGRGLGQFFWLLVPKKRRLLSCENMQQALGIDAARAQKLTKASAVRFGPMLMEVLYLPKVTKETIAAHVTISGEEHMNAALAEGHGVVLATAHSGNWEIMGAALAMHGFPLVAVVQKQTNSAMDQFINEYRTLAGMHVTYKSSVREMVRLLGQGMIVGLLADQDAGPPGVFVDFFGKAASTPQGAAALARLKGAPIIPAFITEEAPGKHRIDIYPAIRVAEGEREEAIQKTTQAVTKVVEGHIRKYPSEWFWLHNRWKTKPPTEDK